MKTKHKVISLILARSGSKSIKHKNLLNFRGTTLLERAIKFSLSCSFIHRTIVSTDSAKYQKIATTAGAECTELRPKKISQDKSKDIDAFFHCLNWLKRKENYIPDIIINLRTTYPIRKKKDFLKAINIMKKKKNIHSVKSIYKLNFPIEKTWHLYKKNFIYNTTTKNRKDIWNSPRQSFNTAYVQNGNIDIVRTKIIHKYRSLSGIKIVPIIQNHFYDIDDLKDFRKLNNKLG